MSTPVRRAPLLLRGISLAVLHPVRAGLSKRLASRMRETALGLRLTVTALVLGLAALLGGTTGFAQEASGGSPALALAGPAVWQPPPGPGRDPASVFDPILAELLQTYQSPGAALSIAYRGRVVFSKGYGLADVAENRPVDPGTRFLLASVSKIVTAQAILQLVREGEVDFSDKVFAKYFPELQPPPGMSVNPQYAAITVYDLLVHAGGWDRTVSGEPFDYTRRVCSAFGSEPPMTMAQLMSYMMAQPLDFPPGTRQVYSNFGYGILGRVVERASARRYPEFSQARVLQPAGVFDMVFNTDNSYVPGQARRYNPRGVEIPDRTRLIAMGAGGWIGSAPDLVRLLGHISGTLQPPLLTPDLRARILAPPSAPLSVRPNGTWFGIGWDVVHAGPYGDNFEKDGGNLGVHTIVQHLAAGFDIALLFNGADEAPSGDREVGQGLARVREALLNTPIAWPAAPQ